MTWQPPWWCRNRHVQTIWGPLLRRRRLALRRERFETSDGDFVDVDWAPAAATAAPLLLLLHGLEGSSGSHYASGMVALAVARGWRAAVFHFRSCSGEVNRNRRFYHAGDTDDLDEIVSALVERDPGTSIVMAGVSLGGNVLLKWLGERAARVPPQVRGAVGISVPFDLVACARALDRGFARVVYTAAFLRTFRQKVRAKARVYPDFVDVKAALGARTFAEYDRVVTAPLHGFADEIDYWMRASSGPWFPMIRRPVLLINALDDPFVPAASLPAPSSLPPCVTAVCTPRGGHVGFVDGRWPWTTSSWAERRAIAFLAHTSGAAAPLTVLAGDEVAESPCR
jgi:predicted alpha/beta-fold hydrolase